MEKRFDEYLDGFLRNNYITKSDKKLLELSDNHDIKLLQTSDYFDWHRNEGTYENLIVPTKTNATKMKRLDDKLDLYAVNMHDFVESREAYTISGNLKGAEEYNTSKDRAPSLKDLKLKLSVNFCSEANECRNGSVDLAKYSLASSKRITGYPGSESERYINRSMTVHLSNRDPRKRGINIVYRKSFESGKVVGSRLYLDMGNRLKLLDPSRNKRLVSFMEAMDYWHTRNLVEDSARIKTIGTESQPDYMSLYS